MSEKPVVLMPEDIQRIMGKDAQRNNILAAKMVAEVIKTTLGPKGMDKMLVSSTGDIIVTNDGVTILEEMEIEHPAAKMMVDVAKTQEDEVGDGTTTAVMISGRLLENAEKLLDLKIHPTVIAKGYRIAQEKCQEFLESVSLKIVQNDIDVLKQIAMTAMTGKGAEDAKEKFSEIVVSATKQIEENGNIDLNNIKIEKVRGEGVKDTELIQGIVLEKEKVNHDMPKVVHNAKICLIDFPLEVRSPDINTKISISSPEQLQSFLNQEEILIKNLVNKIKNVNANVVLCQKGIDDFAQYLLSKEGIFAIRRVAKSDLEKISKATRGKIINNINEIQESHLGYAERVEEKRKGNEVLTFITGCENPKAVSILIHGGTDHVLDEIERAIKDGLGDVTCALISGLVVPGGGAVEIELAKRLREFSQTMQGREQLAVEEFASALEYIPSTLAENAGLDPIEVLTELRSRHEAGEKSAGLNLFTNKVENVLNAMIIEPLKIKSQALSSATDFSTMILRIDDVIAAKSNKKQKSNFPQGNMNLD